MARNFGNSSYDFESEALPAVSSLMLAAILSVPAVSVSAADTA